MLLLLACAAAPDSEVAGKDSPHEPLARWYPDDDGDGFGDDAGALDLPDRPGGWQGVGGDCNDADEAVHPGAEERCNGVDDDCDGAIDVGGVNTTLYWPDVDGDGWGDPAGESSACTIPTGAVDAGGTPDCDDTNAAISPGAPEVCGNGIDDDCDGTVSGCGLSGEIDLAVDVVRLQGDNADARVGTAVSGPGDVDGDGFGDLVVTAPWLPASEGASLGVAWILRGPITTSGRLDELAWARIESDSGDGLGWSVASGDLDGDGALDLSFGYPEGSYGGNSAGRVTTFRGPIAAGTTWVSAAASDLWGPEPGAYLGHALAGGHDLSGDGRDDILIGAPGGTGGAWVVGDTAGRAIISDVAVATFSPVGYEYGCGVLSPGDLDGDGLADIAVLGCEVDLPDSAYGHEGALFVFRGPISGLASPEDAALEVGAPEAGHQVDELFLAGDVDGDGTPDLGVSAEFAELRSDTAGTTWIWTDGGGTGLQSLGDAPYQIAGPVDMRCVVDGAGGDLDGDGRAEVFLGGTQESHDLGLYRGWVLASPLPTGAFGIEDAPAAQLQQRTEHYEPGCGNWSAAVAADVSGDGLPDLLLGLPTTDDPTYAGAAYVVSAAGL